MSDWYNEINEYCLHLSNGFDIPLIKVAGILSALSPQNKFEQNCKDLERFLYTRGTSSASTFNKQKDKAFTILYCENYSEEIIKDILGKKAYKTRAFFENIYRPETSKAVTVDLWQIRWAKAMEIIPQKGVLTPKRYKIISDAVTKQANELNIKPHQFQAQTWIEIRGEKY